MDIINEKAGSDFFAQLWPDGKYEAQLEYGQQIGLGNREYTLVTI